MQKQEQKKEREKQQSFCVCPCGAQGARGSLGCKGLEDATPCAQENVFETKQNMSESSSSPLSPSSPLPPISLLSPLAPRSFIGNEEDVRRFYQLHLEPFAAINNLAHLILPIARRKYHAALSVSQLSIPATIFHARKGADDFVRTLRRYNVDDGVFVDSSGASVPREAIVLYMTVNPMDEMRAYNKLQQLLNERLLDMARGASTPPFNVYKTYKSTLHQCPVAKFVKYDVDTKDESKIGALRALARERNIKFHLVVETRGGYHVVISNEFGYEKSKEGNKARELFSNFIAENKAWVTKEESGAQIVVPGTLQGGYLTRIVDWNE